MIRYLTPAQARSMRLGVDLTSVSDAQLGADIAAASLAVNSATLAPNYPSIHDFRGGTITGETHTWPIDPYDRRPSRRVFAYHKPIIEISSARIFADANYYIDLAPEELYYEESEGWFEPMTHNLSAYSLYGSSLMPYVGLTDPHISLDYTYGNRYPGTEQLFLTEVTDLWIGQTAFWDEATEVRVNGVVRDEDDYTVDHELGTVTMINASKPTEDDSVEIDIVGTLHPNIARATGLITAGAIHTSNLNSGGMGGLNRIRVAEIEVQRNSARSSTTTASTTMEAMYSIPPEAAALLAEFVFYPLAFA